VRTGFRSKNSRCLGPRPLLADSDDPRVRRDDSATCRDLVHSGHSRHPMTPSASAADQAPRHRHRSSFRAPDPEPPFELAHTVAALHSAPDNSPTGHKFQGRYAPYEVATKLEPTVPP
jgi:hypothetical protein